MWQGQPAQWKGEGLGGRDGDSAHDKVLPIWALMYFTVLPTQGCTAYFLRIFL